MTPDMKEAAPKAVKVLHEDGKVRILEVKFRKGEKVGSHTHPPNFVYFLTEGKFKSIDPDGKSTTIKVKKGDTGFNPGASTHAVENVTPVWMLQIEFK